MSSYSIVRLAALHSLDAVSVLETQFPGFKSKSFQEQCDCLFQSRVLYSDSFSRAFRSLGQDASEIVWDFESLQKQWAVENNVETISSDWMLDILMAQIADRKPDVVYFQGTELAIPGRFSGVDTKDNLPTLLKRKFPFIKLVVMYSGFPSQRSRLKDVDLLFSSPPFVRDHYKNMGMNTVLCYHAFDREVLEKLEEKKRPHRFTFVGSTRPPESRYWTLRRLLEVTEIQLWIDEPDDVHQSSHFSRMALDSITSKMRYLTKTGLGVIEQEYVNKLLINRDLPFVKMIKNTLSNRRRRIEDKPRLQRKINRTLPALTLREMYPSRCYPPVIGLDYYSTLSNSRLTFNKHTDFVYNSVGNMRMFEATGVGACLITDTGCNMPDLFEPDKEVVTYANIEEAVEKSQYLLEHDQEREEIAAAGQERTLRDHTIQNRCELINDEIIKRLEKQNSH